MEILQALLDSEIPFELDAQIMGCVRARLGYNMNGFVATHWADTMADAVAWLADAAREHFPDSAFSKARPRQRSNPTVASSG